MAELKDALAYLLKHYPHGHEQSNARVTKMVYLADWHHCLKTGRPITNISWFFDNYGPFVWDVKDLVTQYPELFSIDETINMYGDRKSILDLKDHDYQPRLTESEIAALDHVIYITKPLFWDDFIKTVYGTYPITSSPRYSQLDLVKKSKEYRRILGQ